MSERERMRLKVLEKVRDVIMKLSEAAEVMRISYRQAKRLKARYTKEGDKGIVHRSRGRRSNRAIPIEIREEIIKLFKELYADFGPTLAAEKLREHGIKIDHETLRRLLINEALWTKSRNRPKHRKQRKRKEHFGELVQMDGSHHGWFEERRANCCLIDMVDDATGETLGRIYEGETLHGALEVLMMWVRKYGIPKALYTDRKNIYVTDRQQTIEEQLNDEEPLTAFGKVCRRLGIEIIPANSPQAKGRVERKHGVLQDRLVKELRLRNINTLKDANKFIDRKYFKSLNKKFAIEPASQADYHRPVLEGMDLKRIFAVEDTRVVTNDWTFRYDNQIFQILNQSNLPLRGNKVVVARYIDGKIHIFRGDHELAWKEAAEQPVKRQKPAISISRPRRTYKPPVDHPWRKFVLSERAKGIPASRDEQSIRRAVI